MSAPGKCSCHFCTARPLDDALGPLYVRFDFGNDGALWGQLLHQDANGIVVCVAAPPNGNPYCIDGVQSLIDMLELRWGKVPVLKSAVVRTADGVKPLGKFELHVVGHAQVQSQGTDWTCRAAGNVPGPKHRLSPVAVSFPRYTADSVRVRSLPPLEPYDVLSKGGLRSEIASIDNAAKGVWDYSMVAEACEFGFKPPLYAITAVNGRTCQLTFVSPKGTLIPPGEHVFPYVWALYKYADVLTGKRELPNSHP